MWSFNISLSSQVSFHRLGYLIRLLVFLAIPLSFSIKALGQDFKVPALKSHINDYGNVIPKGAENQLNSILNEIKKKTNIELAVLTVETLNNVPIEMASIQVTDQWQLGSAKEDKGLLLMLAIKDRKLRIEVGQGLEGNLTDVESRRIIDHTMVPLLKSGDFTNAIFVGTYQMLERAAPEANIKAFYENIDERVLQKGKGRKSSRGSLLVILIWIIIIFFGGRSGFLPLLLLGGMGGRGYRGGFGGGGGGGFGGGGLGGGGGFSGGGASGGW